MKKFTKEITALLTLISAGVIGGSVYAAEDWGETTAGVNVSETEISRTVGDAMEVTTCTDDAYCKDTEITPTAGVIMVDTTCTDDTYCKETEITPDAGVAMPQTIVTPVSTAPMPDNTTPVSEVSTMPETAGTTGPDIVDIPNEVPSVIRGRGDINHDEVTDLTDLLTLSLYLLKDIDLDEPALTEADVTKDGNVDIADLPEFKICIMTPDNVDPPVSNTNDSYASMYLSNRPDKTEYKIGEPLDLSGTVISACGHSPSGPSWDIFAHSVSLNDTMVDVDISSFNNKVPGKYTITISYNGMCSTSFDVTVTE